MSLRADTTQLISGALVASLYPGHGVRGDAVPSTGTHAPSPIYNDLTLPADAAKEYRWGVVAAPATGVLTIYENGSFAYAPPDGTTSLTTGFTYRLWQDGADLGTAVVSIQIGDVALAAGLSSEIDTALALTGKQLRPVGLSSETDTSFALAARQIRVAGTSTEVDTALARTGNQIRAVGLATETDSALALAARVLAPAGMAIEVNHAFALTAAVPGAVGTAVEVDSAYAPAGKSILAAGLATEADSAFALTGRSILAVGLAGEIDTALALAAAVGGTALPVGLSVEVDTAYALSARTIRQVGMAAEVDRALVPSLSPPFVPRSSLQAALVVPPGDNAVFVPYENRTLHVQ